MKQKVRMLKTLDGVDEGKIYPATYEEGKEYDIGGELLDCFVSLGGVELAGVKPRKLAPGEKLVEAELPEGSSAKPGDPVNPADLRETKVVAPDEVKPDLSKLSYKELAELAKSKGIKVKVGMSSKALLDALSA